MSIRERVRQRRFPSAAAEAVVSLLAAADHLGQTIGAVCERHAITGDQYNVLRILRGAHPAGHPRREVERRMIRRAPDVTRMLDRLERRGLVARGRDGDDRRLSVARITRVGLALLTRMDPEVAAAQRAATARLTGAQLRQLVRLCDALAP